MKSLLSKIFSKKNLPCQHPSVNKVEYGGFFSFDLYTCNSCKKTWDEKVIFNHGSIEKANFKLFTSKIEKGKIKVIEDNSGYVSNFMTDTGEGINIALSKLNGKNDI